MLRPLCLALATATVATAAQADEGGTLNVMIDGDVHGYTLWAAQSDWSGSESFGSVNIYAQPDDRDQSVKTLSLGFSIMSGAAQDGEINLRTVSNGDTTRYFAGADIDKGGMTVTIDSLTVEGEELSVSGSFQTRAGPSDNYGRDIDLAAGLDMSGTFEVTVGPVE